MSQYSDARNFFEVNMAKDYASKKMQVITDKEVEFLKRCIPYYDSSILDVMCGYGRIGNRLFELGYHNLEGVDLGNFTFINEKKNFKFYNDDFYKWIPSKVYDYCYSLYNSYENLEVFLKTIDRCKLMLNENGILIIDIFNKEWRDSLPNTSYRVVYNDENEKVELFRYYDGLKEKSIYRIIGKDGIKEFSFSQCVVSKEMLYDIIPNCWDKIITDSSVENTRDDNQKNILILRKKENR